MTGLRRAKAAFFDYILFCIFGVLALMGGALAYQSIPDGRLASYKGGCIPYAGSLDATAIELTDQHSGLIEQVDEPRFYAIRALTTDDARMQINNCSPVMFHGERFAAVTSYALTWKYTVFEDNGQCSIANPTVGLHVTQTYPQWQDDQNTDWQRYLAALHAHEQGHVNLDKRYARQLLAELQQLPPAPCPALRASINHATNTVSTALNTANTTYDTQTNHGTTQDAVL